ncbi:MAG: hypothetical protein M3R52_11905 [Acidobacteriota bacterium]|nr:hypothetical protein [Acidobacteriota bacterium]
MKKQAYMIVTMITLMIVAGLSNAKAQSSGCDELKASIPFSFNIGDKTLPAGEYSVRCTNPAVDMKVLRLRSRDGRSSALVQTNNVSGKESATAKLVFNRYGDHYFFAQAWLPGDSTGMQAPTSRSQKQLERELAAIKLAKETVGVIAKR